MADINRDSQIVRTSIVGIFANLFLVGLKAAVGLATNSIAVLLDALNNLGDALSSAVTIVGTKLAARRPDRKHPYGYGRIEYLTGTVVAVIVLAAGVTALRESAVKVFKPSETDYTVVSLALLTVGVAVKLLVGRYVRSIGQRIGSAALAASGSDAFFDAILSTGTILAAIATLLWKVRLEGIVGVLISLVIIKAGVEILLEPLHGIIGSRPDEELTAKVKEIVLSDKRVRGVYDISLHNYGPSRIIGSAHVEVPDGLCAREIHSLTRSLALLAFERLGIVLTLGVYASTDSSPALDDISKSINSIAGQCPDVLQVHGFLGDEAAHTAMFDLVVNLSADACQVRDSLVAKLEEQYPGWTFSVVLDTDAAD
jgi:cation diffusion facilitator family transporter